MYMYIIQLHVCQMARMYQEQFADQVARASEERQTLEKKLEAAEKVKCTYSMIDVHVYTMYK